MYEPSKELIEQIAEEYWDLELGASEGDYETSSDEDKKYFRGIVKEFIQLPTSSKAFELYENQPQWQDKPDREGWWWEDLETDQEGFHPYKIIRVTRVWGELRVATSFLPTIDDYIGLYGEIAKTKFLYIPEPEPCKGEE